MDIEEIRAGELVLHGSTGVLGQVVCVHAPGAYVRPGALPGEARVTCRVVEMSTGDAFVLTDETADEFVRVDPGMEAVVARALLESVDVLGRLARAFVDRGLTVEWVDRILNSAGRHAMKGIRTKGDKSR